MALALVMEGSTGPDVENLQRALNYHLPNALPALKLDKMFGPKTRARTMQFQKQFDLKPDGVVGPKTQQALYSFVECAHHLLPRDRDLSLVRQARAIGDGSGLPPMPPMPRLQMPFPRPFSLPPAFRPPRLEIDPRLLAWLRTRPFEITAGTNMVFRKEKPGADGFVDVTARVWSKPIVKDHLEASGGVGVSGEVRVTDGKTETSLVFFAKVELTDIAKINAVDLAKLQLEGRLEGKPGTREPADMSATLKGGPTIETKDKRFTFGAGGYLEYKSNGDQHELSGGVFIEGAYRF